MGPEFPTFLLEDRLTRELNSSGFPFSLPGVTYYPPEYSMTVLPSWPAGTWHKIYHGCPGMCLMHFIQAYLKLEVGSGGLGDRLWLRKTGLGERCLRGMAQKGSAGSGCTSTRRVLEPGASSVSRPLVCGRPWLLWQPALPRQHQAAESSPLLRGKMLPLKLQRGASAFYCKRRQWLPFVNLLVFMHGDLA